MKKPSIPSPSGAADKDTARILGAMKMNIDVLTGATGGELQQLPADATLGDVIEKVNAMIRRQNRSGT